MRRRVAAGLVVGLTVIATALGAWMTYTALGSLSPQALAELPVLVWSKAAIRSPAPTQSSSLTSTAPRREVSVTSYLPRNDVHDITEAAGRTWLATAGGVFVDGQWLTTREGLPRNEVRAIEADTEGAWIACGRHVLRLDIGNDGRVRVGSSVRPTEVTAVVDLTLDGHGVLIATHGAGAFRVERCQQQSLCATPLYMGKSTVSASASTVRRLTSIATGVVGGQKIIAAGTTGAGVIIRAGDEVRRYSERGGVASDIVVNVEIAEGQLFASTVGGLSRWDGKYWHNEKPADIPVPGLALLDGKPVINMDGALQQRDAGAWKTIATGLGPASVRAAVSGQLATDEGLFVMKNGKRVSRKRLGGPPAPDISALAFSAGVLWIGSFDGGLSNFDSKTFTRVETAGVDPHVNAVRVVASVSNARPPELWVATIGGVYRAPLFHPSGLPPTESWTRWGNEDGLPSDHVNTIAVDERRVWIGTSAGLAAADADGNGNWQLRQSWRRAHGIPFNIIYSAAIDDDGVWLGGLGGAAHFDGETFTPYTFENGHLPDPWVNSVAVAGDGAVWFGTYDKGMASVASDSWTHYREDSNPHFTGWVFPNASIVLPDGSIWFGTMGGGLVSFDADGWRSIRTREGLAGEDVTALAYDEINDELWVGTRTGLSRIQFFGESS